MTNQDIHEIINWVTFLVLILNVHVQSKRISVTDKRVDVASERIAILEKAVRK